MIRVYYGLLLTLGVLIMPSSLANDINNPPVKTTESIPAKNWLEHLTTSLKTLNFSTSFVVVKNNQAEPYRWYHGVNSKGIELEILALLNGPRRDTLRRGNIVSYFESNSQPYSVNSSQISGPIPSVFSFDIGILENSYDFVSVGKSRILGRPAQIIRIVSKDANRYGYWLWLDQESGLLLKTALITREGNLLEQIQFTYLDIAPTLATSLKHLAEAELPKVVNLSTQTEKTQFSWQVNWLPLGFERVKADRHRINLTQQSVEFMQFSDGLVDVSVYVSPSKSSKRGVEFVKDGATVVLNQVVNSKEISVVGKIPANTAKAIADSVSFRGIR